MPTEKLAADTHNNAFIYILSTFDYDFVTAKRFCQNLGLFLPVPKNENENSLAASILGIKNTKIKIVKK